MKILIGTCINNPFSSVNKLCNVIDKGRPLSRKRFFEECDVEEETRSLMKEYPHDFRFYQYKDIFFYTWSSIEHFYK